MFFLIAKQWFETNDELKIAGIGLYAYLTLHMTDLYTGLVYLYI